MFVSGSNAEIGPMLWSAGHKTHFHPYIKFVTSTPWALVPVRGEITVLLQRELEARRLRSTVRPQERVRERERPGSHSPSHKLFHNVKPSLILATLPLFQTEQISAVTTQRETGSRIPQDREEERHMAAVK